MFLAGVPQEGALVTPKMDVILFYRSADVMDCFDLLYVMGGDDESSVCVPPGLSSQDLLHPSLSDVGELDVTGVRFDVSGAPLLCTDDSVRFGIKIDDVR